MPLGLVVPDGPLFEAVANGDAGPPLGRELEIAALLTFIRDERIRNVVFVTGDVHYCAAHHYDPRARVVHRLPSVLGVRRRPGARRHVRARAARQDVRAGSEVPRHSGRHEAEPAAERRPSVFRDAEGRCKDEGADGDAPECRRRHALQNGAAAGAVAHPSARAQDARVPCYPCDPRWIRAIRVLAAADLARRARARDVAAVGGRPPRLVRLRFRRSLGFRGGRVRVSWRLRCFRRGRGLGPRRARRLLVLLETALLVLATRSAVARLVAARSWLALVRHRSSVPSGHWLRASCSPLRSECADHDGVRLTS